MNEQSPLLTQRRASIASTSSTSSAATLTVHGSDNANPQLSSVRGLAVASAIFALIFVLTYNVTLLTTVQSSIAADLQVTGEVSWFVSTFLIAVTSVIPVAAKLCQIFSPGLCLFVAVLVLAVGLVVTAFAPTLTVFLVGRVICGIGSGAVTPTAFVLVTSLAQKERWGFCFGCINCAYTTGVATGAIIGGALEPRIGWRAVFWTQIPVALGAGIVGALAVPRPTATISTLKDVPLRRKLAKIDFLGLFVLVATVVCLLYGLAAAPIERIPTGLSLVGLAGFYVIESHWAVEPIVPPEVLRSRGNILTGLATIGVMCARWGVLFYTPTFAIAIRGWPSAEAGALLIPTNLGFGLGGVVVGLLHIKRSGSFYASNLVCFAAFSALQLVYSRLTTADSVVWVVVVVLFCNGFAAGALLNYTLAHLLHLTAPAHHIAAIALNTMFRGFSGSIGSALMGGMFVRSLEVSLREGFQRQGIAGKDHLIKQLLGQPMLVQKLTGPEHDIAVNSYTVGVRHILINGSILGLGMLFLQAGAGWRLWPPQPPTAASRAGGRRTSDTEAAGAS